MLYLPKRRAYEWGKAGRNLNPVLLCLGSLNEQRVAHISDHKYMALSIREFSNQPFLRRTQDARTFTQIALIILLFQILTPGARMFVQNAFITVEGHHRLSLRRLQRGYNNCWRWRWQSRECRRRRHIR